MTGNILRQRCRLLTRCSYVTVHRSIFSSYVTVHPQHRSIFCSHGGCQHCAASPPTAGHLQLSGVPVARGAAGAVAVLFLLSRINFSLGKLNPSSTAFIFTLLSLGKIMHYYIKPITMHSILSNTVLILIPHDVILLV